MKKIILLIVLISASVMGAADEIFVDEAIGTMHDISYRNTKEPFDSGMYYGKYRFPPKIGDKELLGVSLEVRNDGKALLVTSIFCHYVELTMYTFCELSAVKSLWSNMFLMATYAEPSGSGIEIYALPASGW